MRDNNDELSLLAGQGMQQLQNFLSRHIVQRPRRLIAKDQLGIFRNGACNRYSLLFAPGKLCRETAQPVRKTDRFQNTLRVQVVFTDFNGDLHVFKGCQIGHQVIELEHKAHIVPAI